MNISITASQNTSAILEIRAWLDGQSEALYGNTTSFAVFAGTYTYTVPIGTGSNIGSELSNGTYDFRVLLRTGVNGTILAQRGPNDDSDLNNENFETSSEDTPFTLSIDNVTWSNLVDQDGDGYTRSRTMNITYTSNQSITGALELRAWVDGQSEASYGPINSFSILSGTNTYSTTIGTGGIGGELSHNTYDFRVLFRESQSGTIWTQRGPNDDSDLNNENFETVSDESVSITITTNPSGRSILIDGSNYTAPQTFNWLPGSQHNIGTNSPQAGTTGIQYIWNNWSDGGAMNHTITVPSSNTTYTSNFTTQYYLTMVANPSAGGTVSPQSGWYNSGSGVQISASTNSGYFWNGWVGTGTISYTGMYNPAYVTMNSPITETANFGLKTQITITTTPTGRQIIIDGQTLVSPQTFYWTPGFQHSIGTSSPQAGATGTQYVWNNWSDGGAMNHTITVPSSNSTYTANFTTQYYLTMNAVTGGTFSPQSGWYNAGTQQPISATPNNGYYFNGWTGSGSISYTGADNPATVTMNSPISETPSFIQTPTITITTNPSGRSFTVNGNNYTSPQTFSWAPGSQQNIGTSSPQAGSVGTQYVWNNWSDGGAMNHTITIPSNNITYTANFTTQYYLTMISSPSNGGSVSPQSGWFNSGSQIQISAAVNNGYFFNGWIGTGTGSYSGTNNPTNIFSIGNPITETANFIQQFMVTTSVNPSNSGTATGGGTYNVGASVTVTATANSGFTFNNWTENGNVVSTSSSYQFIMPNNNRNLVANFIITIPAAPTNLSAAVVSSTQIDLNWTDNSDNETGFKIERKTGSGGSWEPIVIVDASISSFSDDSLTTNNQYFYKVRAYNDSGDSPWSNEANATVTGIDMLDMISSIPDHYSLSNNYPNPFNPSTKIQFGLPEESNSTLKVYDILGSEVITLLDKETLSAGSYSYNLVADGLPSGIYLYVLTTKSNSSQKTFRDVKKMILLK